MIFYFSIVKTWQESSRHQLWIPLITLRDSFIAADMCSCNPQYFRCFLSILSFSITISFISLMFSVFTWFTNRLFRLLDVVLSVLSVGYRLKSGPRPGSGPWTWEKTNPLKNVPDRKTRPQRLKTLPFVSSHIKDCWSDSFLYKK